MIEQSNLIQALEQVETINDIKAVLPPELIDLLGGGENGTNQALYLLIGLSVFAPEPASFDLKAFNAVVAIDYETSEPLDDQHAQGLFKAAIRLGLIRKVEDRDRYMVASQITALADRGLLDEE